MLNSFLNKISSKKDDAIGIVSRSRPRKISDTLLACDVFIGSAELSGSDLSSKVFEGEKLDRLNFTKSTLDNVNFKEASLVGCNFTEASMRGTELKDANLAGANLSGMVMVSGDMVASNLENVKLIGASIVGTPCEFANIHGSDLESIKMAKVQMTDCDLSYITMRGATIISSVFVDSDMTSLYASKAALTNCLFHNAILKDACFSNANLENSDFLFADLSGADFTGANLTGASFVGANLNGAIVANATLCNTIFDEAGMLALGLNRKTTVGTKIINMSDIEPLKRLISAHHVDMRGLGMYLQETHPFNADVSREFVRKLRSFVASNRSFAGTTFTRAENDAYIAKLSARALAKINDNGGKTNGI